MKLESKLYVIPRKQFQILLFTASADTANGFKKHKSVKKSTYKDWDRAMLQWFNHVNASGTPKTRTICAEKAKFFHEKLGPAGEFNASSRWLNCFKQ